MANYCFTKYWIEGDRLFLKKLANLIGDGRNVTEILPKMGIPFSKLSFTEEGCPYWYGAKLKGNVLRFTEEAKWEQSQCLWKLRDKEGSGIDDIRYYSMVSESGFYQTNDAEGKHFPYRIMVFCSEIPQTEPPHFYLVTEDNTFLFKTDEEMLSFFENNYGWKAQDREGLQCVAEEAGYNLYASDIEVVLGPMHLGVNKMKIVFKRGKDGKLDVIIKF